MQENVAIFQAKTLVDRVRVSIPKEGCLIMFAPWWLAAGLS